MSSYNSSDSVWNCLRTVERSHLAIRFIDRVCSPKLLPLMLSNAEELPGSMLVHLCEMEISFRNLVVNTVEKASLWNCGIKDQIASALLISIISESTSVKFSEIHVENLLIWSPICNLRDILTAGNLSSLENTAKFSRNYRNFHRLIKSAPTYLFA